MKLVSTNPAKAYEVIDEVEISTSKEVQEKVRSARVAAKMWREIGLEERIKYLRNFLEEYLNHKDQLIQLITKEIGKPVTQSQMDLEGDEHFFNWYLENAPKYLQPEVTFEDSDVIHEVFYEPIGVAAVIQPWNYPTTQFIWGVIPNLLVGNTVVFKHSEECPLVGKLIEEMFQKAGFPEGVFNEVYGDGKIGDMLIHEDIDLISYTGSVKTGRYVYEEGAKKFIKVLSELGGSAPGIVLEDANIDTVLNVIWENRYLNNGQICDGLKRLIVHGSRFDEVVEKLKALLESKKIGNPEEDDTDFGPLVAKRQVEALKLQVEDAIDKGAKVITGGKSPDNLNGAYYLPTILTNISTDMKVWKEEVFGPVLPIIKFSTEQEAVELANNTEYGLGGYIWGDTSKAKEIAMRLETGNISINGVLYVEPFNPFGGYKKSGIGREHGKYGFYELCQLKTIASTKNELKL
jgi:acyl-CoA reductase-like NAD-dependent aldehyde dehydrogenase